MTKNEFEQLKQRAEAGEAKAMFNLGNCYHLGLGYPSIFKIYKL